MSRKKKLSAVVFAVLLCLVLAFTLAACTKVLPPVTHNEEVNPYYNELGTAFANSISADLANGFYIGLAGAVGIGSEQYSFDLEGNVLSKASEGSASANTDFRFIIKKGDATAFGIYNDASNLYLQVGENKYNFANASVMKALRSVLTLNVPGYSDLTNLENVEIEGASLKSLIVDAIPLLLRTLTVDPKIEDENANYAMKKVDNIYQMTLFFSSIGSLDLGINLDLSFLNDLVLGLNVTVENERVKGIEVSVKVNEVDYNVNLEAKTAGIFAAVDNDFDAGVPEDLKAIEASSVLQTDFAGKINLQNTTETGTTVVRSFDWKLVSKLDLIDLIDKNFMLSKLAEGNFFHFQLSHTCNEDCRKYCAENLLSAQSRIVNDRFTETSIIDVAWDPTTMETDNLVADISLWDLVTTNTVVTLVNKLMPTMTGVETLIPMVVELIPSQVAVAVNIDNIAQGVTDQTVARAQTAAPSAAAAETAATSLDLKQILNTIQDIIGVVKTGDSSVTIDLAGLANVLNNLVPGDLVEGLKIGDIVSAVFDSKSGVNAIEANISKNNFGHNADVKGYNTYEEAVKYNIGKVVGSDQRVLKMKSKQIDGHAVSAYGNISGATYTEGAPLLDFKSVEAVDGYINLYYKDAGSASANADGYIVASSKDVVLDNYQLEQVYGGLKNLYFKYTYLDFNKEEQTAYSPVLGFKDFNLNTDGEQEVTLLTGLLMGVGFNTALVENISGLSALVPDLAIPNLETLIPSASNWDTVGKINFTNKVQPDAGSVKFTKQNDKTEIKVDGSIDAAAKFEYTVNDHSYTADVKGALDLKYDRFGYLVAGEYTLTYTAPAYLYYVFETSGTNVLTETITVLAPQSTTITMADDFNLKAYAYKRNDLKNQVLGHIAYTYEDGVVGRDLTWGKDYKAFSVTKDENPSPDDVTEKDANYLTVANGGEYTISTTYAETEYKLAFTAVGLDREKTGSSVAEGIGSKFYYGDRVMFSALGNAIDINLVYLDGTTEKDTVSLSDYQRTMSVYRTADQSSEGISITMYGIAFPAAGNYTIVIPHNKYVGMTFKIEVEITDKVVSTYELGELTSTVAGTTKAFTGMPKVLVTKTTTKNDDAATAVVTEYLFNREVTALKFYVNGAEVKQGSGAGDIKVNEDDSFNKTLTFPKAGIYTIQMTNYMFTGGETMTWKQKITVYEPVKSVNEKADLSGKFVAGKATDLCDLGNAVKTVYEYENAEWGLDSSVNLTFYSVMAAGAGMILKDGWMPVELGKSEIYLVNSVVTLDVGSYVFMITSGSGSGTSIAFTVA